MGNYMQESGSRYTGNKSRVLSYKRPPLPNSSGRVRSPSWYLKQEVAMFQKELSAASPHAAVHTASTLEEISKTGFIGVVAVMSGGVKGNIKFRENPWDHRGHTTATYAGTNALGFSVTMSGKIEVIDVKGEV